MDYSHHSQNKNMNFTSMRETFIIDGCRTAIGNFRGSLSSIRTDDLAALPIAHLIEKHKNVPADQIDDVILGCANQAGEDNRNIARMALLLAGLPWSVPGETVNRLCSSGLSAAIHARRAIAANEGDLFITGGIEHMTRGPLVMSKSARPYGGDVSVYDSSFGWRFVNPKMEQLYGTHAMGQTAENLAEQYNISRDAQDEYAYRSQQKATAARESGRLAREIIPVQIPQRKADSISFDQDEFIKDFTTVDGLNRLRPAFKKDGSVTAGNASGLNDGASALLLASDKAVKDFGLQAKARIVASAVTGVEPRIMGIGPVSATQMALKRAGLTMNDIDIIELNEAFAAQVIACCIGFDISPEDPRLNPNGGAIALGHPLGMTGSRVLYSAALELHEQQKQYALVTMCVGVGQGYAAIIERC